MRKTTLVMLVLLCAAALGAFATSVTLASAEYDVVVRPDGKAAIYESLDWTSTGGMHGFYFEGVAAPPCSTTSSATPTSRESSASASRS